MRFIGLLAVLAGASTYWLAVVDRRSTIALDLVELVDPYGRSLSMGLVFFGLVAMVAPLLRGGRRVGPGPVAPSVQRATVAPSYEGNSWLDTLRRNAAGLVLERGASVEINLDRVPPVKLLMDRLTPEQARRSVDLFAEFLSHAPLPGRVALVFRGCPREGPARNHQVNSVLRKYFTPATFVVVEHEDTIEVMFKQPDARWRR